MTRTKLGERSRKPPNHVAPADALRAANIGWRARGLSAAPLVRTLVHDNASGIDGMNNTRFSSK